MSKFSRILTIMLAGCSVLFFLFSLLGVLGVSGGLPGFLFRTFHVASFYIPVYFALCSVVLLHSGKTGKLLLALNLSLLPFINLTLLLHVLSGNRDIFISRYLITELGPWVSLPFLLLLLLVECALIYKLCNFFFAADPWLPDLSELKDLLPEILKGRVSRAMINLFFRIPFVKRSLKRMRRSFRMRPPFPSPRCPNPFLP